VGGSRSLVGTKKETGISFYLKCKKYWSHRRKSTIKNKFFFQAVIDGTSVLTFFTCLPVYLVASGRFPFIWLPGETEEIVVFFAEELCRRAGRRHKK